MTSSRHTPKHVAIIMDGNGRWAQRRGHSRVYGHVRGANRVKPVVKMADELGVQALTLFTFSTENWKRPQGELRVLWQLLKKFLVRELDELDEQNVQINVFGEVERLGPDVRSVIEMAESRLKNNTGLKLNFAISYGSRAELTRAAREFAQDCVEGRARPEDLTETSLNSYLWTRSLGELSDVDLVIRTSGELRVSNFLLWQSAYAEYFFTQVAWPEFSRDDFVQAIDHYLGRERRFGGVSAAEPRGLSSSPSAVTGSLLGSTDLNVQDVGDAVH